MIAPPADLVISRRERTIMASKHPWKVRRNTDTLGRQRSCRFDTTIKTGPRHILSFGTYNVLRLTRKITEVAHVVFMRKFMLSFLKKSRFEKLRSQKYVRPDFCCLSTQWIKTA